jgi:Spy/CpxP family protein refolding chaperone
MFEEHTLLFFAARAATLVVALLLLAVAFGRWRRAGRRDMQVVLHQLDETRTQTRALFDLAQGLVTQVAAMERRIEDRQHLVAARAAGQPRGYDLALQMARHGASPDEMVCASGVTRPEAALLARLHNPPRGR